MSKTNGREAVFPTGKSEETLNNGTLNNVDAESNGLNYSKLRKIEDVPNYLRYNPYIKCGYRQALDMTQCCYSLFFFHNETVNIYTHGLFGLMVLFWIPYASPPSIYLYPGLFKLHYIGCISPFIGSTIYHLFMCHHSGANTYDLLLKFDMCGVWAINAFGGVTAIKATLFCFPNLAKSCITLYWSMALVLLYYVLTAKSAKERFFPLVPFGIVRYAFLVIRTVLLWQGQPSGDSGAIIYYILMDLCALFGGILNITRFPERYVPNKLDFFCNSHNIMHVLVSLCPVLLHWGTMLDFNWMGSFKCHWH